MTTEDTDRPIRDLIAKHYLPPDLCPSDPDAIEAMLDAAASDAGNGHVFNLGGPPPISLRDLAALMIELNGAGEFSVRTFPAERKRIDIGDYYSDFTRIRTALGWEPRTSLREALGKTLEFYRANLAHYV